MPVAREQRYGRDRAADEALHASELVEAPTFGLQGRVHRAVATVDDHFTDHDIVRAGLDVVHQGAPMRVGLKADRDV